MEFPILQRQRLLRDAIEERAADLGIDELELFVYLGLPQERADSVTRIRTCRACPDDFDLLCRLCFYVGVLPAHPTFLLGIDEQEVHAWLLANSLHVVGNTAHYAEGIANQLPPVPKARWWHWAVVAACVLIAALVYPVNAFDLSPIGQAVATLALLGLAGIYLWQVLEARRYHRDNWHYVRFTQQWWRDHESAAKPAVQSDT